MNDYKKEVCQCRNCGAMFNQNNIKKSYIKVLGVNGNETQCPKCGSTKFGLVDYIDEDSIEGVYKKHNFFRKQA